MWPARILGFSLRFKAWLFLGGFRVGYGFRGGIAEIRFRVCGFRSFKLRGSRGFEVKGHWGSRKVGRFKGVGTNVGAESSLLVVIFGKQGSRL